MPGILHPLRSAPSTSNGEDGTIYVPSLDEALALALSLCPAGESVSLHEAHCPVTPEAPHLCDCEPQIFIPQARGKS